MTEIHIVDAIARTPECTTEAVWQYAYGLELRITGIDLPEAFEVQQCNDGISYSEAVDPAYLNRTYTEGEEMPDEEITEEEAGRILMGIDT